MRQREHIGKLKSRINSLKRRLKNNRSVERQYRDALDSLKKKEEYNFALFQFSPIITIVVDKQGKVVKSNMARKNLADPLPAIGDVMFRDQAADYPLDLHRELMESIRTGKGKRFDQIRIGDRFVSILFSPFPQGAIIATQDITDRICADQERMNLIKELRTALEEVETLRGLLPMCASCKKIRDDSGYWNTIEVYFKKLGNIDFSHTLCPECMKELYPELWEKMERTAAEKRAPATKK